MERGGSSSSSSSGGRFNRSLKNKPAEFAESSHSRSLASRLGMAEMSCFPSSRSKRLSDIYDGSRANRRSNVDHSSSSSSKGSSMFSRSFERGKARAFPRRVNGELARDEAVGGIAGTSSSSSSNLVEDGDKGASETSSDSEDEVFELATAESDRTYRNPSFVTRTISSRRNSSFAAKTSGATATSNNRGVHAAATSAITPATAPAASSLELRPSSTRAGSHYNPEAEFLEFQLDREEARPLNSRRLSSPINASSRGGRSRAVSSTASSSSSSTSRLPSPLRRSSRLRHGNVDNSESAPYNRRNGTRRSVASSTPVLSNQETDQDRRRNISNCFPAFGNNQGRRSSSPFVGESRRPPRGSSLQAFSESRPAFTASSSSSSRGSSQDGSWSSSGPPTFGWEYHRPRLMAEGLAKVLIALERMEGDDELTHEQLLMLEATVLFGGMALHDEHRDWRLDVDSMSYEELLALGDRIGTVNTGVGEDILAKIVKTKFSALSSKSSSIAQDGERKCSICQEEYADGDELGWIDCGHRYHASCIAQWLVQKNLCPICKATALTTA